MIGGGSSHRRNEGILYGRRLYASITYDVKRRSTGGSATVEKGVARSVARQRYRSPYVIGGFGSVMVKVRPACGRACESGGIRIASYCRCARATLTACTKGWTMWTVHL